MCKLGLWKSVQVHNTQWSKQIIDMSITVTRATKVMHIVGAKLNEDPTDQITNQQLSILARVCSPLKEESEGSLLAHM